MTLSVDKSYNNFFNSIPTLNEIIRRFQEILTLNEIINEDSDGIDKDCDGTPSW